MLMNLRQSKTLSLLAKTALTLGAFWLALRGIDMTQLADMAHQQIPLWLGVALLMAAGQIILGVLRWQLILSTVVNEPIPSAPRLFKIYYMSVFFNSCLPGTIGGDVVRVFLARQAHIALPLAIQSVIIDRLIALVALALLVVITLPMRAKLVAVVLALVGIWLMLRVDGLARERWQHLRLVAWLLHFTGSLRQLLLRPASSFLSLTFAVLAHISYCLAAYALAVSLNLPITAMQCITLIPPVMLAITLPISIGGWGVREAGMVGMLALAGIAREPALLISVQLGLAGMAVSFPGGLLWLVNRSAIKDHK